MTDKKRAIDAAENSAGAVNPDLLRECLALALLETQGNRRGSIDRQEIALVVEATVSAYLEFLDRPDH
ncbi:MAG: hypothetical protein Tsb0010_19860 [Parvularculaceae bacterium]